jgi:DNA-binding NarL/FixJ family response regulator
MAGLWQLSVQPWFFPMTVGMRWSGRLLNTLPETVASMQSPTDKKLVVTVLDNEGFTKQEVVILNLVCQGLTRKEIAIARCRSFGTISKHIENIALKLNAKSQAEIVAKAIALGIVRIGVQDA